MKVTIYTVADCQFSKAEKEYLKAHNQSYDEKNLETNKEFLTEMLNLSNNFSGTPVTKVEKDDGEISILKGFTKEEFDKAMGYSQSKAAIVNSTIDVPTKPITTPPVQTTSTAQPPLPDEAPASPAGGSAKAGPPPVEEKKDEALNAVLNDLQSKTETPPPAPRPGVDRPLGETPITSPSIIGTASTTTNPPTGVASKATGELPNIPEPDFK